MSKLTSTLRRQDKRKLIPFLTVGDPSLEVSLDLVVSLAQEGVAAIELGVPYSDPVADGPVIQRASERALANGIHLGDVLDIAKEARKRGVEVPLILFSYLNPTISYGFTRLCRDAVEAGIDAFILPDLPYEESNPYLQKADEVGIDIVPLVAPTSLTRVEKIVQKARGFVYAVSSLGTTGIRSDFAANVEEFLTTVRELSPVPTAVGFGISLQEQVAYFHQFADAVIVGSALVQQIEKEQKNLLDPSSRKEAIERIIAFVRELIGE